MAGTKISNIVVPSVFIPYVAEKIILLSALFTSGIIQTSDKLNVLASQGGKLINMPYFKNLTGSSEVLADATELTATAITTGTDIAALLQRGKMWGVSDLAKSMSGADPLKAIGDQVAAWWADDMQTTLINILTGVFLDNAGNDDSDLISDIATETLVGQTSAANHFNGDTFQDAIQLLGDAKTQLVAVAMHSQVESNLRKLDLIDYAIESEGGKPIPYYGGKRVIVDDTCPVVAGTTSGYKYTSYIFAAGVIAYGDGVPEVPVETDRNAALGEDYLINRKHYILHPVGIKFTSTTVTGHTPSDVNLALAVNWDRVYQKKNIGIVQFITNG